MTEIYRTITAGGAARAAGTVEARRGPAYPPAAETVTVPARTARRPHPEVIIRERTARAS